MFLDRVVDTRVDRLRRHHVDHVVPGTTGSIWARRLLAERHGAATVRVMREAASTGRCCGRA
jgi:hypothetical protein